MIYFVVVATFITVFVGVAIMSAIDDLKNAEDYKCPGENK